MEIIEVQENRKQYLDLLLLADEQEEMIDKYIHRGWMFILLDGNEVCSQCIVTDEGDSILEIKSLSTKENKQKKGYATALISYIENRFKAQFTTLQVGTGESPLTLPFYFKCGFTPSHRIKNFFLENYDHEIIEEGVKLIDMIYLRKSLTK